MIQFQIKCKLWKGSSINSCLPVEDFRMIAQAETAVIKAWQEFGGVDGTNVDEEQIRGIITLEVESALRTGSTLMRGISVLTSKSAFFFGLQIPPLLRHTLSRKALVQEINDGVQQKLAMQELDTLEGRLEACLFFSEKRTAYESLTEQMGDEAIRRGRACSRAIELLLFQNNL